MTSAPHRLVASNSSKNGLNLRHREINENPASNRNAPGFTKKHRGIGDESSSCEQLLRQRFTKWSQLAFENTQLDAIKRNAQCIASGFMSLQMRNQTL